MTVGKALERKGNNFNLLRMFGALCIVLGHSILLTGRDKALSKDHPVLHEGIELLAYNSLYVFFVLSGLMVAMRPRPPPVSRTVYGGPRLAHPAPASARVGDARLRARAAYD
jgi:hypothetical protein